MKTYSKAAFKIGFYFCIYFDKNYRVSLYQFTSGFSVNTFFVLIRLNFLVSNQLVI